MGQQKGPSWHKYDANHPQLKRYTHVTRIGHQSHSHSMGDTVATQVCEFLMAHTCIYMQTQFSYMRVCFYIYLFMLCVDIASYCRY